MYNVKFTCKIVDDVILILDFFLTLLLLSDIEKP